MTRIIGTIDVGRIKRELERKGVETVTEGVKLLKEEVDRLTPEDTKTLLGNNRTEVIVESGLITGIVSNDTEYAEFVEYGVSGRNANYHKPKGVTVYSGVGNRTFTRAILAKKAEILALFRKLF